MAGEFIARNGIISKNNVVMTGSLTANKLILSLGSDQAELTSAYNNDFKLTNSGSFRIVNGANTTALLTVTNGGTSSFSGNVLIGTSTDSNVGFNRVLAISNDYLPSLELRKTGSIGGTRTYNVGINNLGSLVVYDATVASDRLIITNSGSLCIGNGISSTNITTYIYSTAHGSNPALWVRCVTNEVPVSLFNDGNAKSMIGFKGSTSANEYNTRCGADVNDFVAYTNNTERMRINSSGYITAISQPSFYATSTAGSSTYSGSEVIVFNTTRHNIGSCYNTSNGRFTAPIAGRYMFSLNVYNYSGYTNSIVLTINGSQYVVQDVQPLSYNDSSSGTSTGFTIIWELAANDYIEVRVRAGGSAQIYRAHSHFSGCLLS